MINLGSDFDKAVLEAAGVDWTMVEQDSVDIGMVPKTGPATIRYTQVVTLDSETLRQLIAEAATPVAT